MNLLYLLLLFTSSVFLAPVPTEIYSNLKILIEPDVYIFHWNYTKVDLTGEIHVKTNGWVAFGLTPNGGMDGSDVFVSWLDTNGKANFTDRYIRQRSVLIDKQQDWELISASISDEYTIVKFRRDIQTCDTNDEDLVIEEGTPRVLYAFGLSSPLAGRDISYHGSTNRGSKVVQLLTALKDKQIITHEDKIKTFDFTVNATIPSNLDTLYYCEMFKLPDEIISRKHHLLKVETLPPLNDDKSLFHHWIVYQCDSRYEKLYLANNPAPEAGNCFNEEWTKLAQICVQITLAWAVGGELVTEFPNGLGFPLGGTDAEFKYFKFQIHYNNPDLATIRDQSGIRFYLTENLRKTEIGIFTIGATSTWNGISIPPKAQNFKLEYSCRMDCTNELYNGTGVTVFAVAPHTHLVGAQVYTKIIRNGREIGYVQKTKNYDFNYQYLNFLNNPVVLKPNDEIKTTCIYNTASRLNFTFVRTPSPYLPHLIAKTTYYFAFKGGISTYDEMCLDFLYYYPRRPSVGMCLVNFDANSWLGLFMKLTAMGLVDFTRNFTNETIKNDLKTIKPSDQVTQLFQNFYSKANQSQVCITNKLSRKVYPSLNAIELVENETTCENSVSAMMPSPVALLLLAFIFLTLV